VASNSSVTACGSKSSQPVKDVGVPRLAVHRESALALAATLVHVASCTGGGGDKEPGRGCDLLCFVLRFAVVCVSRLLCGFGCTLGRRNLPPGRGPGRGGGSADSGRGKHGDRQSTEQTWPLSDC
jgi:hypothetical protein